MNKKTIILVGIVLEVEIGPKATKLDWRRNFFIAKFDLGGGNMKVYTINIRSVKLHTMEPIFTATEGDGGERADYATKTTTGYKNITDSVSIRVFEAPALDPLNYEALRVVVSQPMNEMPGWSLSILVEAGG